VATCGISSGDFPFYEDGVNQSSNLVLSAHPNTEGSAKKGCVILTEDCCDTIQKLGTWASLSKPTCLIMDLTLTLNNGHTYSFSTTTGRNDITPCNVACYDKDIPIWLAPAGAQPSPCLKATLLQTISQCNKTICWTVTLDTTNDSVGPESIGSIVDVGCTKIINPADLCGCYEAFSAYDYLPYEDANSFKQTFVASGYEQPQSSGEELVPDASAPGLHGIILSKGVVLEGDYAGTETTSCTERYIRTVTTQVGLYQCQVFNFWAAVYAKPQCVGQKTAPVQEGQSDVGGIDPNDKVIQWTPDKQRATYGSPWFWVVRYANDGVKERGDGKLRFELSRATSTGNIVRASTRELFDALRTWANQLRPYSPGTGEQTCVFQSGTPDLNDDEKSSLYAATTFIGIGDRCSPYSVFTPQRTGINYEAVQTPYTEAAIIRSGDKSPWFGIIWSGNPQSNGISGLNEGNCIC